MRGGEITRLEALADGAFALALTFLVIAQQQVPQTVDELLEALKLVPAFALSFVVLILFWSSHVRWSRRYGMEDAAAAALSCLLIFIVLVIVYPLKMVFGALLGYLSGGWLPGALAFHSDAQLRQLFIVYGLGFIVLELTLIGLFGLALQRADGLGLNALERFDTRGDIGVRAISLAVGVLATVLAIQLPASMTALSGYSYWLIPLGIALYRRGGRRQRKGLLAQATA
jgi:hypothetical protein